MMPAQTYLLNQNQNLAQELLFSSLSFAEKKIYCNENGYKLKEFTHGKGTLFAYHAHSYREILIVKKGCMRLIIEEEILDICAGEHISIAPWAIHLLAFLHEETNYYYIVSSSPHRCLV